MTLVKRLNRYVVTVPPIQASTELRDWLSEEFDLIQLSVNGALETIDELRSKPSLYLGGLADGFNLDETPSKFVNYTLGGSIGDVAVEPDLVAGEFILPRTGVYTMTAYMYGLQPSNVQNETIQLLVGVNGITTIVATVDVTTNQTEDRALSVTMTRVFSAGDVISMSLVATGNLGAFTIQATTLEALFVTLINGTPSLLNLDW